MSLTLTSIQARKIIRYAVFFVIFLILGRIFLNFGVKTYKRFFPAKTPPPTVKYGKLNSIPFPDKGVSANLNYILETAEGSLPTKIPTQAKVYFMPKASAGLLSLDTAKSKAKSLGFDPNGQRITEAIYKFGHPDLPTVLQINIITMTFSISYDLVKDSSPIDLKPPVVETAATNYKRFLTSANMLPEDLTGPVTHNFFKVSGGELVNALSLSEANFIKINLFRRDYDGLPIVTGNPDQANVWAIMSGSGGLPQQIIATEFHYHAVDETQYSTYPIKTPEMAFTELQNGQAFIARLGLNEDGGNLKIRDIYLAYFDPGIATEYFQPVYVFEGDNGFVAYLPAVIADYYQTE